jgi:hypothetical protein
MERSELANKQMKPDRQAFLALQFLLFFYFLSPIPFLVRMHLSLILGYFDTQV